MARSARILTLLTIVTLLWALVAPPIPTGLSGPPRSAGGLALSARPGVGGGSAWVVPTGIAQMKNDPRGQAGSGGEATAFHPSGRAVTARERALAPDALLFNTGINAIEPTLGITDDGTLFYIGVQGDEWPIFATDTVRSSDGGASWDVVTPSVGSQSRHPYTEDPYLHVDKDTGRVFTMDFLLPCTELSFSDDDGDTWTSTVMACDLADHQTLFTGPPVTSDLPDDGYPNVVYYCAIDGGVAFFSLQSTCVKSGDGGLTWLRTGDPAYPVREGQDQGVPGRCIGAHGHGAAGPDGTIYVPRGWCGEPYLALSSDEGATWEQVRVSDLGMANGGGRLDHDAAVGIDSKGNIYYAWTAEDFNPYLSVSRNRGKTWSKPVMFAPPGVKEATLIALDVERPGRVAVAFIGSTTDEDFGSGDYDGYMMLTTDALAKDPLFYATTVNDPADHIESSCSTGSCRVQREFIDIVIGPDGTPWASFVDGCYEGSCSHSGPFLGIGHGIVGRLIGGPKL